MSKDCDNLCSSCNKSCADRDKASKYAPTQDKTRIKKIIAVASGKGGVGKSTVTSLMAVAFSKAGYKCAILDADITGPSIPRAFGIEGKIEQKNDGLYPKRSKLGVSIVSMNLLLDEQTSPVIWRGPVISGAVKQFYSDFIWEDIDYMFVDMPPGTGDVPLTVFQSLPVNGIIFVTTPSSLVGMIVEKAVNMAEKMNIPVLSVVENEAYYVCKHCGEKEYIFGTTDISEIKERYAIPLYTQLPIDPAVSRMCDEGNIEAAESVIDEAFISSIIRQLG